MRNANEATKRYNLVLPTELFDELQRLADRQGSTVVELLRRFIKLGLLAANIEEDPNSALLIRQGDQVKEIVLL